MDTTALRPLGSENAVAYRDVDEVGRYISCIYGKKQSCTPTLFNSGCVCGFIPWILIMTVILAIGITISDCSNGANVKVLNVKVLPTDKLPNLECPWYAPHDSYYAPHDCHLCLKGKGFSRNEAALPRQQRTIFWSTIFGDMAGKTTVDVVIDQSTVVCVCPVRYGDCIDLGEYGCREFPQALGFGWRCPVRCPSRAMIAETSYYLHRNDSEAVSTRRALASQCHGTDTWAPYQGMCPFFVVSGYDAITFLWYSVTVVCLIFGATHQHLRARISFLRFKVTWLMAVFAVLTATIRIMFLVDLQLMEASPHSMGPENDVKVVYICFILFAEMGMTAILTRVFMEAELGHGDYDTGKRVVVLTGPWFVRLMMWLPVVSLLSGSVTAWVLVWLWRTRWSFWRDALREDGEAATDAAAQRSHDANVTATVTDRRTSKAFSLRVIDESGVKALNLPHFSAEQRRDAECVVCIDQQAHVIVVPCGHCVACWGCAHRLHKIPCPLCRGTIERLVVVDSGV
eukprot:GFYU01000252.1.p1 GENE.GFYU01000252.1~~GFYU01000252.1.p1  ORF type:complete len:513 (+),score=52.79 GFYU01000252.1:127-1665(+)